MASAAKLRVLNKRIVQQNLSILTTHILPTNLRFSKSNPDFAIENLSLINETNATFVKTLAENGSHQTHS